jgi:hypothetical protein
LIEFNILMNRELLRLFFLHLTRSAGKMAQMAFVNDLDALAWVAIFATIIVCCSVTFLNLRDWRNNWKVDFEGRIPIIVYLGIALMVGAFNSYSPNANAPRKTVEGIARFVAESHGKHRYDKYICAGSCQLTGGYALDLRDEASSHVRIGSSYVFTYLEKPIGGAFSGISLRVIAISEPDSGRTLYELDLSNHPYRVAAYLCALVLLICSGVFGALLRKSQRGHADGRTLDEEGSERRAGAPQEDDPISLRLESKDAS